MADAAINERWNHTAALMAMLANIHRDAKRHKAFKPADFHPLARKSDGKIENVGVDVLKMLVKEPTP